MLISFLGAPLWFITLSPADNRHPICLYFADTGEKFSPELRLSAEHNQLIAIIFTGPHSPARVRQSPPDSAGLWWTLARLVPYITKI